MMIAYRQMTESDVTDGMRLKAQAGWNQIEADWRRFLAIDSDGCFVVESEGRVVGSATSCRFGPVGWVAMVLVEKAHRGAGVGRSLLARCLGHLEACGVRSVRLDATTEGRPLYESLGFRVDFSLHRYGGVVEVGTTEGGTRPRHPEDVTPMAALDRAVTGTDRRPLVDRLVHDNPLESLVAGSAGGPIRGFVLWRPGSSAVKVGPCIAERDAGRALLDAVGGRLAGRPVVVDVPAGNGEAVAWAEGSGLTKRRDFWRMTRGEAVVEDLDRLWASSGPEMG